MSELRSELRELQAKCKHNNGFASLGMHSHCRLCGKPEIYILRDTIESKDNAIRELVEGMKQVRVFIYNGRALGFIRMPDEETPDTALQVPPLVDDLISKYEGKSDDNS